jgi:hypothetical protein
MHGMTCARTKTSKVPTQRRSEDYTGMQRGQARFITYYWFLALRRHYSVGIRCVYTSTFREIPKRFYRKKIVKWWIFALFVERKLRFWVDMSLCLFTVCQNSHLIMIPEGLPCDELECRQVQTGSYLSTIVLRIVWRIVLCPAVVNGIKNDEIVRWLL